MNTRMSISAVMLLALVTAGCADSLSPTTGLNAADNDDRSEHLIAYGLADDATAVSPGTEGELFEEYGRLRAAAMDIVRGDQPLPVRDRELRALLSANHGFGLSHYLEQYASVQILREAIQHPGGTALETVDHFTGRLIDSASPEAELIHACLQRLTGHWDDDRVRLAAERTVERSLRWAEKVCSSCDAPGRLPDAAKAIHLTNLDSKRRRIVEAAGHLQRLAGP